MKVAQCKHGFKYLMVGQGWNDCGEKSDCFLYVDDVCLIASNEQTFKGFLIV